MTPSTNANTRRRPRCFASTSIVALLATVCAPTSASALEKQVWAGASAVVSQPGTANSQVGPGLQLGFDLSVAERWGVRAGIDTSYQLGRSSLELPAAPISDLFVGVRYNFDTFKYVPYASAELVGYLNSPPMGTPTEPGVAPALGTRLKLGVLWRPSRNTSMGARIQMTGASNFRDASLTGAFGFDVGYHWR